MAAAAPNDDGFDIENGFDFEIDGHKVDDYICLICSLLLRNTAQLPCNHMMCRGCLDRWIQYNPNLNCPKCHRKYTKNKIQPNQPVDHIIKNSLKLKCKSYKENCNWVGSLSEYFDVHSHRCDYFELTCRHKGCNDKIKRMTLAEHEKACIHRPDCNFCNKTLSFTSHKEHYDVCPMYPVQCPYSCTALVPKSIVEDHIENECPSRIVPCGFKSIGCNSEMEHSKSLSHFDENIHPHMELMLMEMQKMKNAFDGIQEQLQVTIAKLKNAEGEIAKLNSQGSTRTTSSNYVQPQQQANSIETGPYYVQGSYAVPQQSLGTITQQLQQNVGMIPNLQHPQRQVFIPGNQMHHQTAQLQQLHQPTETTPKKRTVIKITDPNSGKDLTSEIFKKNKTPVSKDDADKVNNAAKANAAFAARVAFFKYE